MEVDRGDFMDIPFVRAKDFYLRELRASDLDGPWYAWFNDAEVTRHQNKKIFPNTREKQRTYYEALLSSDKDVVLAIVDEKTKKHIGNVGLHKIDWIHRSAELGIVLGNKAFWGRKIGKRAWALITAYGFQVLNLNRIYAYVLKDNLASRKSAEAAGFVREGTIREFMYKNGCYVDAFYMNVLKSDAPPLPVIQ